MQGLRCLLNQHGCYAVNPKHVHMVGSAEMSQAQSTQDREDAQLAGIMREDSIGPWQLDLSCCFPNCQVEGTS